MRMKSLGYLPGKNQNLKMGEGGGTKVQVGMKRGRMGKNAGCCF